MIQRRTFLSLSQNLNFPLDGYASQPSFLSADHFDYLTISYTMHIQFGIIWLLILMIPSVETMCRSVRLKASHSTPLEVPEIGRFEDTSVVDSADIVQHAPTRSLDDMHCGTGCVTVLLLGSFIILSVLLMAGVRMYSNFTLKKDRERFARRETELRHALGRSPGFPQFFTA